MKKLTIKTETIQKTVYLIRLLCRYFIGVILLFYASGKILKTQFNLSLSTNQEVIGNLSGFELTWYYYGYSRAYVIMIALVQILSALLLFFRRTERMGVILFFSFMVNIFMIDYFYDIDIAKPMANFLIILGTILLLTDWKAFKFYFFKINYKTNKDEIILPSIIKKVYKIKYIILPIIIIAPIFITKSLKENRFSKNQLYGVWQIERMDSSMRIRNIYFEHNNRITILDNKTKLYYGKVTLDEINKTIKYKANHYSLDANYFIEDSINKLTISREKLKETREGIREYYNKTNNALTLEQEFDYKLNADTLYLKNVDGMNLKFINITKEF